MNNFKKYPIVLLSVFVFVFFVAASGIHNGSKESENDSIKVTILYDNYVFSEGTKADWGFSCLIEGTEKKILFDTGTKSDILWHNIAELNVDIDGIDQIVISHNHGDHTGGLFSVLKKKQNVPVYIPISFPDSFVKKVEGTGAKVVKVNEPVEICKDVYLTGEMGTRIKEHALILNTSKGLVVITGCAHPGIVDIVRKSGETLNKKVYFVLGGFHLLQKSDAEVQEVIKQFREMGVVKCGATHCTGDNQIKLFQKDFDKNYVQMGTGRILEIAK